MRKIFFLILVYFFTTAGFFKSALEDCADIKIKTWQQFNKTEETRKVKLTEIEQNKEKIKYQNEIEKCKQYAEGDIRLTVCQNKASMFYSTHKVEVIRKITSTENERAYKKFISKTLKNKINEREYEEAYSNCIDYKENSPELFKAKYD